jgi:hypothetical protein
MPPASVRQGKAGLLSPEQKADERGAHEHQGERQQPARDQHERRDRERPVDRLLQRAAPDAYERLHDHRDDRRLEPGKRRGDRRHVAVHRVDEREPEQDEYRGQDEAESRDDAARRAVEAPADPGRELHGLWAGDQHADVQRLHELALLQPALPLDDLAMHDRDLSRGAAEGNESEPGPEAERLGAGGRHRSLIGAYQGRRLNSAIHALIAG